MPHNRNDKELLTVIGILLTGVAMLMIGSNLTQRNIALQIKQAGKVPIKNEVYACHLIGEDRQ